MENPDEEEERLKSSFSSVLEVQVTPINDSYVLERKKTRDVQLEDQLSATINERLDIRRLSSLCEEEDVSVAVADVANLDFDVIPMLDDVPQNADVQAASTAAPRSPAQRHEPAGYSLSSWRNSAAFGDIDGSVKILYFEINHV